MSENPDKHGERKTLRDQAEKQLGGQPAPGTTASPNEKMLLHELQVHQIELEMQNEALQQAQDAERTSLARYTELFDFAPIAYFNLAQDGSILQTNLCGARLLGRDRSDLVGRPLLHFVCEPNRPAFTSLLHNVLAGHEPITCEVCLETAIATSWVRIEGTPDRQQHGYLLAVMDITDRKRAEKLLYKQALIDPLTELPNRRLFLDRLDHAIQKCQRDRQKLAVLFLDLDRFKDINDTLGHDIGDKLLKEASGRLKKCIRETDTLARPGGDEFILILEELNETDSAERVAQNLLHSMEAPFHLGKEYCYISISIGMTFYPDDARETIDLLKKADQAMYAAKLLGRNQLRHFTPAMQSAAEQRLRLSNDLRQALADNQLLLNYQPIVDLATGSIRKAEALIRWQHPERGLISPAEFIPIAEETGLILEIGEWAFRQAADQVQHWRNGLQSDFQMSINNSPRQFHSCLQHHGDWFEYLADRDLPGNSITVEITEDLLLEASPLVIENLQRLRDAGLQISLDDFGTGYSALSYLAKFEIDYLKIDQSFVKNLGDGPHNQALCEAMIVLAHKLGIKVIAEGIETQAQMNLLAQAGCDYGQGYWFAKPLAVADFESLFASSRGLNMSAIPP